MTDLIRLGNNVVNTRDVASVTEQYDFGENLPGVTTYEISYSHRVNSVYVRLTEEQREELFYNIGVDSELDEEADANPSQGD